jgi:choice-of-anchor A domain-containing protein
MKETQLLITTICALILIGGQSVNANAFGTAGEFNAVILDEFRTSGGNTEGRLAIGGNATIQSYSVGRDLSNSHGTRDDLIVGGDLQAKWGWQVAKGNAVYGGKLFDAPTTPNGSVYQGNPLDFDNIRIEVTSQSQYWSTLDATGSSDYDGYATLRLIGTDPHLNVINVDGALWSSARVTSRYIDAPAGSTVLINVSGTSNRMSGGLALTGGVSQDSIVYNFYETTALHSQSIAMLGSVLAPDADLTMAGGYFDGVTIVGSAETKWGGGFQNSGFTGNLPAMPAPEPATAMLLLAAAGCLSRRRRPIG